MRENRGKNTGKQTWDHFNHVPQGLHFLKGVRVFVVVIEGLLAASLD